MKASSRPESERQTLGDIARTSIEEARMVLPGIQALWGFQLIAVFNDAFAKLDETERLVHFASLMLVALAIALIMTPAAYHRIAEQGTVSAFFIRLAAYLIAAAMAALMVAISLEVYLVAEIIFGVTPLSFATSLLTLTVFAALWFAFPLALCKRSGVGPRS